MHRNLAAVLTAAALVWAVAILAAPFALGTQRFAAPAAITYIAADRICHQRPDRSFHLDGAQLPVCARCAGLYLSAAAGVLVAWTPRRRWRAGRTALAIAAAPTIVTWGLEVAGVMSFSNLARAIAAVPLGAVGGWLFVRMLRYDSRLDGEQVLYS